MKHKGLFGSPLFSSASSQISFDFCSEADRDVELCVLFGLVWITDTALFSFTSDSHSAMHSVRKETNGLRTCIFKAL